MITIVTHAANFHTDDIFAVALLSIKLKKEGYSIDAFWPSKKIRVLRSLDPKVWAIGDYVVDIGGEYDVSKKRFDHHQEGGSGKRVNGVPYASFGLVWKEYGEELTGSKYSADWVDRHIVQGVDGMDSGMYLYTPVIQDVHPFLFEDYFRGVCDLVKGENVSDVPLTLAQKVDQAKKFDKEFMRLVKVAEEVISIFIQKSKQREVINIQARKAYEAADDKRIIISDVFIPSRFDDFKAPEFVEPLVFVSPNLRGEWSAKVVTVGDQTYDSRIKFPESWRGKRGEELEQVTGIKGASFCHNSGFLAVGKTREVILAMVAKVIN